MNRSAVVKNDEIVVTVDVRNEGKFNGDEVVQVYYRPLSQRIRRPLKQLCGFRRVNITAGETARVEISIPLRELEFYDVSRQRFCLESGEYELMIGTSSDDIREKVIVIIDGETIPPRDFTAETEAQYYDRETNTDIYIDPITSESHVRGLKWVNTLTYQNVDFSKAKTLQVLAAAVVSEKKIAVIIDGKGEPVCELTVCASDGYTDFSLYSAELSLEGCHDITLSFGENVSIKSLKLI